MSIPYLLLIRTQHGTLINADKVSAIKMRRVGDIENPSQHDHWDLMIIGPEMVEHALQISVSDVPDGAPYAAHDLVAAVQELIARRLTGSATALPANLIDLPGLVENARDWLCRKVQQVSKE